MDRSKRGLRPCGQAATRCSSKGSRAFRCVSWATDATANAVLYPASDEARFVTGAEDVVDGGMTVRCG